MYHIAFRWICATRFTGKIFGFKFLLTIFPENFPVFVSRVARGKKVWRNVIGNRGSDSHLKLSGSLASEYPKRNH
jgi:hypothetical protein